MPQIASRRRRETAGTKCESKAQTRTAVVAIASATLSTDTACIVGESSVFESRLFAANRYSLIRIEPSMIAQESQKCVA